MNVLCCLHRRPSGQLRCPFILICTVPHVSKKRVGQCAEKGNHLKYTKPQMVRVAYDGLYRTREPCDLLQTEQQHCSPYLFLWQQTWWKHWPHLNDEQHKCNEVFTFPARHVNSLNIIAASPFARPDFVKMKTNFTLHFKVFLIVLWVMYEVYLPSYSNNIY